jgi:SAM-dependent methyltransferase
MIFIQLLLSLALLLLCIAVISFTIFAIFWAYYFTRYIVPYVPTQDALTDLAIAYAKKSGGKTFLDIGAGDGKVVIAAAHAGFDAVGIEANPLLVHIARWRIRRAGLQSRAKVIRGDFFASPFPPSDIVFMFLLPQIVRKLKGKLQNELPKESTIIVHSFPIPDWEPTFTEGKLLIYKIADHQ